MHEMIRKTEFFKLGNDFQYKLKQDLETIRSSKNVLAFWDESTNLYKLSRRAMRNYYTIVSHKHTKKHVCAQNEKSIEDRRNLLKTSALNRGWNATQIIMCALPWKIIKKVLEISSIVGWSIHQKVNNSRCL